METRGLVFIPDISGFTRFVNDTEIEHSRMIIQELLEIMMNANQMDLQVSEIEGDAILFYKFGDPPKLDILYRQVEKMFCDFHKNILSYDDRRYCQCKACRATIDLSLKVVTHYGEFTDYKVRDFHKLIGKDIIVAHQLLKNDIDKHEYWLVTANLIESESPKSFEEWMNWQNSVKQTEAGEVPFHYTMLSQLKNKISPEPILEPDLTQKEKMFSVNREYDADIITLFHASGDFQFRHRWMEGVKGVEEMDHHLPRVGMKCKYVTAHGEMTIHSSSYTYEPGKIVFSETNDKEGSVIFYTLQTISEQKTSLTLDFYTSRNLIPALFFKMARKHKTASSFIKSMVNLEDVVKEIHLPQVAT